MARGAATPEQVTPAAPRRAPWSQDLDAATAVGVVACATPLLAALVLAFRSGGFAVTSWGVAVIVLLAVLAGCVAISPPDMGWLVGGVLAAWALLAGWQGLSGLWASEPGAATRAMGLTALYGAAAALAAVGLRRDSWLRKLVDAALAAAAVVALAGVGARILPSVIGGDDEARLSTPLTYWNALGALMAFGAILALGIAAHPGRGPLARSLAATAVPLFSLALLFTLSRGALVAFVLGLAVLLAAAPGRIETAWVALVSLIPSTALVVFANGQDGLTSLSQPLPPHDYEGRVVLVALLVAAAIAAGGAMVTARAAALVPVARRRVAGIATAGVAVLVAVVATVTNPPEGGPFSWARDQFDSFRQFDPGARAEAESVSDLLGVAAGSGRWQMWGVAQDQFASAPIAGTGAGDFRFDWAADRPIDLFVVNAHSLYLEVLAESGLIGLLLLLAALLGTAGAMVWAIAKRPDQKQARELGVVLAAGAVTAAHVGGDWDWQIPAAVLPAVVLGGGGLAVATRQLGLAKRATLAGRGLVVLIAAFGILLAVGPLASAGRVSEAKQAARDGDLSLALERAEQATSADPQNAEAWLVRANILSDLGRPVRADAAYAAALSRAPRDWTILADWGAANLRRGDNQAAVVLIERAGELNPREPRIRLLKEAAAS